MRKAKDALDNLNGLDLDGREIRLDFAKGPSGGGGRDGGGSRGGGGGGGRGQLYTLMLNVLCMLRCC